MSNSKNTTGSEIVDSRSEANRNLIEENDLRNVKSLDDAFALMDSFAGVEDFADYGTGFEVLDKRGKDRLVGNPFMILEWRFNVSREFKSEYVSFLAVTKDGNKYIVNDGSTGICKQLRNVTDSRIAAGRPYPQMGLRVSNGLRRSDYDTVDDSGNELSASTYYLA